MRFAPLFLLLLPLAEIAGFVIVGNAIGVAATLGLVILSTVAGILLLRVHGMGLLMRFRDASRGTGDPGQELVRGATTVFASLLLIVPGFLTDILGLLLLMPFARKFLWALIAPRIVTFRSETKSYTRRDTPQPGPTKDGPVIDLETEEFHRDGKKNSPWSDNLPK